VVPPLGQANELPNSVCASMPRFHSPRSHAAGRCLPPPTGTPPRMCLRCLPGPGSTRAFFWDAIISRTTSHGCWTPRTRASITANWRIPECRGRHAGFRSARTGVFRLFIHRRHVVQSCGISSRCPPAVDSCQSAADLLNREFSSFFGSPHWTTFEPTSPTTPTSASS
jgi:hypothetical protein